MKRYTLLIIAFFITIFAIAQSVTITESGGWFETAYAEWNPVSGADRYNVYYSGNGLSNEMIDDQLIRSYGTYWRADIPGLAAGTYTISIAPVIGGTEGAVTTTGNITVIAHDRSGFAFANGVVPSAYKADGTPKDGAVIVYITENTKNTVSLTITGANSNPCVGFQTVLEGIKKGDDNRPFIFRLVGNITDLDYMLGGDIVVENSNNVNGYVTIEGIGEDATANGWGIRLKNATNIEIRNIGTMNCNSDEGDNIGLQQANAHIWVHNCDFFYGDAGSDSDQAKGDGALDSKKSTNVTHSYNHFWDSGKSNLLGNGGEDVGNFTYHHNWYDHSDSRHPRVREHTVHVYNNYLDGNSKYGIGNTTAASLFAEANYFRNCKYPMLISNQGSDVYGDNENTFSGDPGGMIKAYNNYMEGETRFVDQTEFPNDFDAYVVSSATEQVPSSVTTVSGGHVYNNFDTDASMYSYTAESPQDARNTVVQYAGRMNGGDFQWTFNNSVDDTDYAVNQSLKDELVAYTTNLVYIQGDGEPPVLPPNAQITAPTAGSEFDLGASISITATASDTDGSVNSVDFYADLNGTQTHIQSDNTAPYEAGWTPSVAGTYTLYAIATDNDGNTGSSNTNYTILIDDPLVNDSPSVSSVSTDQTSYVENSDVTITAVASDDNAVTRVEFYNGASYLGTANAEPFTYTLSSLAIGSYTITARAFDEEGLSADGTCSFEVLELNESDLVHNFTESALSSSFFSISGNLSTDKGTVNYQGLTLTQCLKMESSTLISFTTAQEAELVLVFNEDYAGGITVSGTDYTASAGIVTITLPAGSHSISKKDVANLYYMSITYTSNPPQPQVLELKAGWNMVGCPLDGTTELTIALSSIWGNVVSVKNQDKFYLADNESYLNTLDSLEWGGGYLIYVSEACSLEW
jgi:pectate lyase